MAYSQFMDTPAEADAMLIKTLDHAIQQVQWLTHNLARSREQLVAALAKPYDEVNNNPLLILGGVVNAIANTHRNVLEYDDLLQLGANWLRAHAACG